MQRSAPPPVRTPEKLTTLPRKPLSAEQQLDALRRVQAQAEQRVTLGVQLFKAAEARVSQQRDILDQVKQELAGFRGEQNHVREQVQDDVTRTLHQYDQWIGSIDENFTKAMRTLQERLERLEADAAGSQGQMESMLRRAEALLDQTRVMISQGPVPPNPAAEPPAPPKRIPPAARKPQAEPVEASDPPPAGEPTSPPVPEADKPNPIYLQLLRRLRGDAADKAA